MDEFQEKRKIVQAVPVTRPASEAEYRSVVHERRGISGASVAALVFAAVAAAVVITMVVMNNQQRARDDELAQERAQATGQTPAQPSQQQQQPPAVVVVPPSQAKPMPGATPTAPQSAPAPAARSSAEIEVDIASRLQDDPELRYHPIDVKFVDGIVTLSEDVPTEALKLRAERTARRVKGVTGVINTITVRGQS